MIELFGTFTLGALEDNAPVLSWSGKGIAKVEGAAGDQNIQIAFTDTYASLLSFSVVLEKAGSGDYYTSFFVGQNMVNDAIRPRINLFFTRWEHVTDSKAYFSIKFRNSSAD